MRRLAAVVAAFCALAAGPAWADSPPFETPDTDIEDRPELAMVIDAEQADGGAFSSQTFDLSIPLSRRFEVTIAPSFAALSHDGHRRSGLGDTELAVKAMLLEETATRPAVAVEPSVILPTARRGLGAREVQIELPLSASKAFGPYRLTAQIGYAHAGMDDYAPMGLLVERALGPRWSLGAEVVSQEPLRRRCRGKAEVNAGLSFQVRDGLELHGLVGRGFGGDGGAHARLVLVVEL